MSLKVTLSAREMQRLGAVALEIDKICEGNPEKRFAASAALLVACAVEVGFAPEDVASDLVEIWPTVREALGLPREGEPITDPQAS